METLTETKTIVNKELKLLDDATTELAEMLEGFIRTPVELYFDGEDLLGRDGRSITDITDKSLDEAHELFATNPNLYFEVRRRHLERDEVEEAKALARGDRLNTMVVLSDFPQELQSAKKDIGGYNISRKQAYLRVYIRQSSGGLIMYSQSLDQSDRKSLNSIYEYFGVESLEDELLGQRIHADLPETDQEHLTDKLTAVYDQTMSMQYGGQWYAGRPNEKRENTYDFVCKQSDLLNFYIAAQQTNDRHTLYNVASALQERFDKSSQMDVVKSNSPANINNEIWLQQEILIAGQVARKEGKTFSACGITLENSQNDLSTDNLLEESGMGNKTEADTTYDFDKEMHCVVCQAPPKKDEAKKMCGPCGICRQCDKKLKSKMRVE